MDKIMKLLKYIFFLLPFASLAQSGTTHTGRVNINNGTTVPTERLYVNGTSRFVGAIQMNAYTNGVLTVNGSGVVGVTAGGSVPAAGANGTILISNGTTYTWGQGVNASIATGANIDALKLGTGAVSTTEFNYLDGVTSSIQTQLNAFAPSNYAKVASINYMRALNNYYAGVNITDSTSAGYNYRYKIQTNNFSGVGVLQITSSINGGIYSSGILNIKGPNVGILNTNPIVALDVTGDIKLSGTVNTPLATGYVTSSAGQLGSVTTIPATGGGTGQSSYAVGDILYASTTTALSKLADVATGNALISGGVGVAPSYGKIGLTTHVSGTLPVSNGGIGVGTLTGYAKGNGTSAFTASATIPIGDVSSSDNDLVIFTSAGVLSKSFSFQYLNSSGSLSVGGSADATKNILVGSTLTGGATVYGVSAENGISSATPTNVRLFNSELNRVSGSVNLTNSYNYYAGTGGLTGGSLANHHGFFAASNITDAATLNTGFYGDIAYASGRWNLYMNGTADNYLEGRLGIGSPTPNRKLYVMSNDTATYNAATLVQGDGINIQNSNNTGNNNFSSVRFVTGSTGIGVGEIALIRPSTGSTSSEFAFKLRGGAGVSSEVMRLKSNGNLGLGGTNSPNNVLQVVKLGSNNSVQSDYGLMISQVPSSSDGIGIGDFNTYKAIQTFNAKPLALNPAGNNVGIGTTAPNAPLQFSNALGNRKIVLNENANNDHQFYGFGIQSGEFRTQATSSAANFTWNIGTSTTTSSEIMRLSGTGNLGVGKVPTTKLDVNGIASANRFQSQGSAPTIAAGAGAGTGPTIAIAGRDNDFKITLTTGTTPTGTNAIIATVTYAGGAYPNGSIPTCTAGTTGGLFNAALLSGTSMVSSDGTTTTAILYAGTVALAPATQYVFNCHSGGY